MTFIRDCLYVFLLTACMEILEIKSLDEKPKRTILSELLHLQSKGEQYTWIRELCYQILTSFVYNKEGMQCFCLLKLYIYVLKLHFSYTDVLLNTCSKVHVFFHVV